MTDVLDVGDVVQIKSGGSKMTIESVTKDGGYVSCVWSDKDGEIQRGEFSAKVLSKSGS